jgi:hypothetical protein
MAKKNETESAPTDCAQCGGDIPRRAKACPHCGADERTGWREASVYDGIEFPEDEENERNAAEEAEASGKERGGLPWYWTAVALVCLILAVLYATRAL